VNIWENSILKSIASLGGEATLPQIYDSIQKFKEMTENDLKKTKWGGRPAFQHQIRSHISNLCQEKSLSRLKTEQKPVRYLLTIKGKSRIQK
jgi:hypothetical protein